MISPRRVAAVLKKELLQLRRDKMTFAMVIMIPLIQLLLFGYAINTNLRHVPVALVDQSENRVCRGRLAQTGSSHAGHDGCGGAYDTAGGGTGDHGVPRARGADHTAGCQSDRLARSPSVGLGLPDATNQTSSRPVAHWIVDGSDTMVASAIKSLRTMPLTELLKLPPNRQVPTFEVTLYFNPGTAIGG